MEKPEYAQIFLIYQELKILNHNLELERLAEEERGDSPNISECGHTNLNFSSSSGDDTSPVKAADNRLRRSNHMIGDSQVHPETEQRQQTESNSSPFSSHSTIKIE